MLKVCREVLEDSMYYDNILVLTYKIYYPCIDSNAASVKNINDLYFLEAKNIERHCRTVLYQLAQDDARDAIDRPFNRHEFVRDFTVTYNVKNILSLYTDAYTYTGGAHGNTVRTSNTWNLVTGTLIQLGEVYPLTPNSIINLRVCIQQQISERLQENPGTFFENYTFLLNDTFNASNFFLQPFHGTIYYQQYDIAPYSTGIPEFYFPICSLLR